MENGKLTQRPHGIELVKLESFSTTLNEPTSYWMGFPAAYIGSLGYFSPSPPPKKDWGWMWSLKSGTFLTRIYLILKDNKPLLIGSDTWNSCFNCGKPKNQEIFLPRGPVPIYSCCPRVIRAVGSKDG